VVLEAVESMEQQQKVRCAVMRGGTSKGAFFHLKDLPEDLVVRDRVLLSVFGSPDARQIDGLGGADPLTSKVAVVSLNDDANVDVNYTFGQVNIDKPFVDYRANCGNISAAVGPFAIDEGLVEVVEPVTKVRILNTNTGKMIEAEVPVSGGKAEVEGDFYIPGVPNPGARIRLGFVDPVGSVTGKLLPTGQTRNMIDVPGHGMIEVSIVDAGNPCVFVRASDLGLIGDELPSEIEETPGVLDKLESARAIAAVMIGLIDSPSKAAEISPSVPKIAIVGPAMSYQTDSGSALDSKEIDLVARIMSMQRVHKAYALTGAIALILAAGLPGTIVSEVVEMEGGVVNQLSLGHPDGAMRLEIVGDEVRGGDRGIVKVIAERTARRIMDGFVYVPQSIWMKG